MSNWLHVDRSEAQPRQHRRKRGSSFTENGGVQGQDRLAQGVHFGSLLEEDVQAAQQGALDGEKGGAEGQTRAVRRVLECVSIL